MLDNPYGELPVDIISGKQRQFIKSSGKQWNGQRQIAANSGMVSGKQRQIAANSRMVNAKQWDQALGDVVERPAVFFCSDKMTSLDILDMHVVNINDFCQYLQQISPDLSQINEICFWGCELKLPVRAI